MKMLEVAAADFDAGLFKPPFERLDNKALLRWRGRLNKGSCTQNIQIRLLVPQLIRLAFFREDFDEVHFRGACHV